MVFITGGSGFLGSRIIRFYEARGEAVCAPTHAALDLCDAAAVLAAVRCAQPQLVVHCAAISDVAQCARDEAASYAMNVQASEYVAQAAAAVGAKLLFCSSDQVYFFPTPQRAETPAQHREDEQLQPVPVYGRHKLLAEQRCLRACPDAVGLRLTWMYDITKANEHEHGSFYTNTKVALAAGTPSTFPLHDFRGITDVRAVIENLPAAATLPGGVYNFGAPNTRSTYDTVRLLFAHAGERPDLLHPNADAFSDAPRSLLMNLDLLRSHGIDFEDTLTRLERVW